MPDFVRPHRGARHTLDTALRALRALGVDDARVVLESAGAGWARWHELDASADGHEPADGGPRDRWAPGAVVRQHPPPGAPLDAQARVTLAVTGVGALEALPYALRDVDSSAFGVDPIMALLDNPVHKLRHHLRGGGEFFALRPGDPVSARRWIQEVFQIDPAPWAPERWPALARLLPALHRAAGREEGLRLALRLLFALPLAGLALEREVVPAAPRGRLALGRAAARLGVDALLGAGRAEVARLALTVGPVPLDAYLEQQRPALAAERRALYALVVPAPLAAGVRERWVVGDPREAARLAGAPPGGFALGGAPGGTFGGTFGAAGPPAALGLTARLGPAAG